MRLECNNCQRSFELDEDRLAADSVSALRCVCNAWLDLAPAGPGAKPHLGKYILVNRITTGGMGEIYYGKVAGIEGFEKEVAIKRLLPHLSADRDFVAMMVKEAKLTVLLNHPNIVGIYDLARQDDEYYIAMEYVPGVTVAAILEATRRLNLMLPPEVPVHLIMQVLRGLSYAHNLPTPSGEHLTILHRDITPQNILVTQRGYVKITDFGIAKAVNEISTTSAGMIKGKLGYIAPEQLEGKEPDNRIDLFCAGILLWEMFMARRLFKGTSEIDTFRMISECHIPPFSSAREDVPRAIEAVVSRALARNPDDRFAQADAFNEALSTAIQPRTADDYARATATFFAQHPDFFAAVVAHKGNPELTPERATALPPGPRPGVERLQPVGAYTYTKASQRPAPAAPVPAPQRLATSLVVLCAALAGLLASGGYFYQRVLAPRPSDVEVVVSHVPLAAPPAADANATAAAASQPNSGLLQAPAPQEQNQRPRVEPHAAPSVRREPPARPLTGAEIQATVQGYQPDIARCLAGIDSSTAPSKVEAQVTIEPSGRISVVNILPPIGQPAVDRCMNKALHSMRFHRHPAPAMKVTIPLKIQVL